MNLGKCAVHSNLMGRYAVGWWRAENPSYVHYWNRKKKVEYTEDQQRPYDWIDVTAPIVAVSLDTDHKGDPWLKLWVLVDGKPEWLASNSKVMPVGWEPNLR